MYTVKLIRVGSAKDNDVVVNHEAIAPYHLELFQDKLGKIFLTDLGSESGTFVNNTPVDVFKPIEVNDQITIAGKFRFDWSKIISFPSVPALTINSNSHVLHTEVSVNKIESVTNDSNSKTVDFEIDSFIGKCLNFYYNNTSIVHIFSLNLLLFLLFYFAFLS
jgi:pSer/pThr/pTyr-binding forkhead associated (FHA) protein